MRTVVESVVEAQNTIGIGPWSISVGPLAVIVLVGIIWLVVHYVRKDSSK